MVGATALDTPAAADTAPATGTPATVSADPLPTVQQNGVVWSQVTVGNIVYATGSFSQTWPAGQSASSSNETPRTNLLAYNITTGALVTSFSHTLNAQGLGIAASPDGSTVYVVGDFTTVDGATHNHIAAFNTSTGALVTGFTASLSGEAAAVTASASSVYVGGNFFSADGVARTRLAALNPSNGALLSWAPTADDGQVAALAIVPNGTRVIVGGRFTTIDSQAANGMGSVDATSGAIEPWAINTLVQDGNANGKCGITTLSVDGSNVYGGGFSYGCGNFEGTFAANPTTGAAVFINDCHGDTYATQPVGSVLYVASHSHDCSAIGSFPNGTPSGYSQRATAYTTNATGTDTGPDAYGWNYSGQPDGSLLAWFPTLAPGTVTNQDQAAWSVTGNASYVAYGGEFPTVNGTAQAGLVRFAVKASAPNKVGPIPTSTLTPTVSALGSGQVAVSWTATWDRDNANLTYTILRDGTAVGTVTQASSFWQLPSLTYTDKGLTPGTAHTYRIRVSDPLGNIVGSGTSASVTAS